MMGNHVYNLMMQMVQENKSLWRIKNKYLNDAGDCPECKSFWEKIAEDKTGYIIELEKLVKKHLG